MEFRADQPVRAPAEAVYDLLADISTHAGWGGRQQLPGTGMRLEDVPAGAAKPGTEFASTSRLPGRTLVERSRVTRAERPAVFEFETRSEGRSWIPGRKPWDGLFRHTYEIAPDANGCVIRYTFREERLTNPGVRFGTPGLRGLSYRIVAFVSRRGLRNLAALAERR